MGKKNDLIFVCSNCGSDEVETKQWVKVNSGKVATDSDASDGEPSDNWCPACEGHHGIITKQTWDEEQEEEVA